MVIGVSGELYVVGEKDLATGVDTPFVKIGIVRENDKRSTDERVKEHQTGNPRQLHIYALIKTPAVERMETMLHGKFAPWRVSGEWFHLDEPQRAEVIAVAQQLAGRLSEHMPLWESAAELEKIPSTDAVIDASDRARALRRRHRELDATTKLIKHVSDAVQQALLDAKRSGLPVDRFITIIQRADSQRFDEAALKEADPDLWATFVVPTSRWDQRLLVTKVKGEEMDVAQLEPVLAGIAAEVDGIVVQPDEAERDFARLHSLYLQLLTVEAPALLEHEFVEAELKAMCGDAAGIEGVCTWKRLTKTSDKFDSAKFREAYPEEYARLMVSKPGAQARTVSRDLGYRI